MSGKKEYEIVKTASEVPKVGRSLDRVQNVFPPPKGRIDKRNLLPILATVVVWATCLPFAYRAWKNKKVENKIESIETAEPAEIEKPKKLRLSFKSYEEMGVKNFDSNRPTAPGLTVTVNEEKNRVEILDVSSNTWKLKMIPFRRIQRDSDGQLVFDERGRPVTKPFTIKSFFSNILESLKEKER